MMIVRVEELMKLLALKIHCSLSTLLQVRHQGQVRHRRGGRRGRHLPEFDERIAAKYKIREHRSKKSSMRYAFDHADVPDLADYLEVQYSPKYPALPSDLAGETFSR